MNCRLSLSAISCPHANSTLSHPKPSRRRWMHRITRSGEKGTESTSHFYHLLLPEHGAVISWAETAETQCWASPVQGLTEHSTWQGTTQILQNQHQVTLLFGSASIRKHYITLWVSLSHYFCTRIQKTSLTICCSEKRFTGKYQWHRIQSCQSVKLSLRCHAEMFSVFTLPLSVFSTSLMKFLLFMRKKKLQCPSQNNVLICFEK